MELNKFFTLDCHGLFSYIALFSFCNLEFCMLVIILFKKKCRFWSWATPDNTPGLLTPRSALRNSHGA